MIVYPQQREWIADRQNEDKRNLHKSGTQFAQEQHNYIGKLSLNYNYPQHRECDSR